MIVHTETSSSYARRIASSLNWINEHKHMNIRTSVVSVNEIPNTVDNPRGTLINARAAIPESNWMSRLEVLETSGVKVINSTRVLKLTSDKLTSGILLNNVLGNQLCPMTWELNKNDEDSNNGIYRNLANGFYVLKPYISMEQGANVTKFTKGLDSLDRFINIINSMPTTKVVLQRYIDYVGIHRVICINGHSLPFSFVDMVEYHPDNWKVSVCLNKTTMRYNYNPNHRLLELAEQIQQSIGGNINFIDIFETRNGNYVLSEINTACNLGIHERLSNFNIHYQIAKELVRLCND